MDSAVNAPTVPWDAPATPTPIADLRTFKAGLTPPIALPAEVFDTMWHELANAREQMLAGCFYVVGMKMDAIVVSEVQGKPRYEVRAAAPDGDVGALLGWCELITEVRDTSIYYTVNASWPALPSGAYAECLAAVGLSEKE